MSPHETTHRALIAASAPAADDAELLALIRRHQAAIDYTNSRETNEEVDAAGDVEMALFNDVLRFPVRTSAGFMVKLRFYADLLGWDTGDPFDGRTEERGLVEGLEDGERLGGGGKRQ